jgi:hypothetical protein
MLSPYSELNIGTAGSIETSVLPVYETTQQHASDYLHIKALVPILIPTVEYIKSHVF